MKVVTRGSSAELLQLIKERFAEFNSGSRASKGRHYPKNLQALVFEGFSAGASVSSLLRLTNASPASVRRWTRPVKAGSVLPRCEVKPPQRLEVVGSMLKALPSFAVIRFRSGVSIELSDPAALGGELLTALAGLGVQ